jgi:YbbR domain-containing protein
VHVRIAVSVAGTTRTVPVVPVVQGTPAAGFAVAAVRVQPVSVMISGPRAVLEGVEQVMTEPLSVEGARDDVSEAVALALPEGVSVEGSASVRVTVTVSALTGSRTYVVGVVLSGTSDTLTYEPSIGSVLVTVTGTLAALNALDGAGLQASGSVAGLGEGAHSVALSVAVPGGLTVSGISPPSITVTITSQATPTPGP